MHRSFLKIAFRHLWRNKTYSLLNFICLTFGLAGSLIAMLYILYIAGYDRFNENYDRLYAVNAYVTYFNGDRFPKQYLSASLADMLTEKAPEIEAVTRVTERDLEFIKGDVTIRKKGISADSNFFSNFTFRFIHPPVRGAMSDMSSVIISERMARQFFDSDDCVGETLVMNDGEKQESFTVAGVFRDVPGQSSLQFDFVMPFSKFMAENRWASETGATACEIWVLLRENAGRAAAEGKIKNLIKEHEETLNQELFLFPLKEKVLYSYAGGRRVWKEMKNTVIAGAIGFAILLIACFNFINLTIAVNFRRCREAGIRKVTGSGKKTIVIQFLGEAFIIIFVSLVWALAIVSLLLQFINPAFGFDIRMRLSDLTMTGLFAGVTLFTGIASGLLPALYMGSINPTEALKGKVLKSHSYSLLRQSLIVFQYTIPIVLMIAIMIIKAQDRYLRNYDIGVDKERLIVIENTPGIRSHEESFRSDLNAIPGIDAVSFTNCVPTRGVRVSNEISWEGKDATEKLHFWCVNTDFNYASAVTVKITDGRFFSPSYSADSSAYLINDVAARVMNLNNPVGSLITVEGRKGPVIGVFTGFHAIDLAGPVVPTIMRISPAGRSAILVRYSTGTFSQVTADIKEVFDRYETEAAFNATLFRDLVPYTDLSLPSRLVSIAFLIALLLACMGLSGLASFTAESRTKEIGIRKANGATTSSVMRLLLSGYIKWLFFSTLIALPVAFMVGKFFLGRFNFHVAMPL